MKWNNKEITIKKSTRKKTMNIVIERDGNISVLTPENTDEQAVLDVLNRKEYEITQKLLLWNETHANKVVRRYVDGQSFMYLGRNYILQFVENQRAKLLLKNGKFLMSDKVDNPRQEFIDFYKKQSKIKVKERFDYYKKLIDVNPTKMDIRDIQKRWGSCSPKNEIYYHWKCIMAPIDVLDYIIVHELIHIEEPNHSRNFWHKLSTVLPNYEIAKNWLTKNGIRLDI